MSSPRLSEPYHLSTAYNIWSRAGYGGIAYNDGNEVEERLLSIVTTAKDRSVLSSELKAHCTDWPSLYHLSSSRANVLRPFEEKLKGSVLEIGAGCGAITRYLGECGAQVLALEGTLRRAKIARARTHDLPNVAVLAESFAAFESQEKFDVVTLIGVLEYASMFVEGPAPDQRMLERARELLKPNGLLIIAIENQLGLKYFAGAPEDHVSQAAYGLENRYQPGGVRTYGRHILEALLKRSGFHDNRFLACFPDYKFPVSVVSEAGFDRPSMFDVTPLAIHSVKRDPQLPGVLGFRPERVWGSLVNNHVALDLANSFLITACNTSQPQANNNADLAWHFSTERRAEFCKVTKFSRSPSSGIDIRVERARKQDGLRVTYGDLTNQIDSSPLYVTGAVFASQLMDIITRDQWDDASVGNFILRYFDVLSRISGCSFNISDIFKTSIPGKYIDATPQNILFDSSGEPNLIDTEWAWHSDISPAYLLFRSIQNLSLAITKIGRHETRSIDSPMDFIEACFTSIGQIVNPLDLQNFAELEQKLQDQVSNRASRDSLVLNTLKAPLLSGLSAWEKIETQTKKIDADGRELVRLTQHIHHLTKQLSENEAFIDASNQLLHERLALIHTHQATIANRDAFLQRVLTSRSWKVTRPLRFFTRQLENARVTGLKRWAFSLTAKSTRAIRNLALPPKGLCICIHAYYPDVLRTILEKINALTIPKRVIITTTEEKKAQIATLANDYAFEIKILVVSNRGRDVLPFLIKLKHVTSRDLILKIHTKKSPHRSDGDTWRNDILSKLLAPHVALRVFEAFRKKPALGMVGPDGHILSIEKYMGDNVSWFSKLKSKMPKGKLSHEEALFSGGTMFYVRPAALQPLLALGLAESDFEEEAKQLDGTLAHAIERLLGVSVGNAGFFIASSATPQMPATEQSNDIHPL